jgi:DNA-binding CsgD family transcriptional regulator
MAQAQAQLALALEFFGTQDQQPQHLISPARLTMSIAARQGRLPDARAEFQRVAAPGFPPGTLRYALPLLCAAAAMEAGARGLPEAAAGRQTVLTAIRGHAGRLPPLAPVWRAYELMLGGELARAEGSEDPEIWERVTAAFEPLERPYELALARRRLAAALLDTHTGRSEAAPLLAQAHRVAVRLGAGPLAEDTALLAGRAGISLPVATGAESVEAGGPGSAADPLRSLGLTPREQDVLRLVAAGRSNRRIAEELYIAPKTASVHVSNILAKLGVSGRTEAAAMAHRLGLFAE